MNKCRMKMTPCAGPWQWLSIWHSHYEEGMWNKCWHELVLLTWCAQSSKPAPHLSLSRTIWTSLTPHHNRSFKTHASWYWMIFLTTAQEGNVDFPVTHYSMYWHNDVTTQDCDKNNHWVLPSLESWDGWQRQVLDEATSDHRWLWARNGAGPEGRDTKMKWTVISWLCVVQDPRSGCCSAAVLGCRRSGSGQEAHFWQQLYILRWHSDLA